jgi:hypothetical protein
MSDSRDEQDMAEALDADRFDPQDFPPEHSPGVADLLAEEVTAAGDYAPDDLITRLQREEPDVSEPDGPDASLRGGIDESGAVGEPDDDVMDRGAAPAEGSAAARSLPAEEAALHITDEPI